MDFKNADYTCLEGQDGRRIELTLTVGNDTFSTSPCFGRVRGKDLYFPAKPGACP